MTSQQPDNTSDDVTGKNRTITILASALAVIAVVAVALLIWSYIGEDPAEDNSAAAPSSTVTVEETPVQSFT
ncbi:MAG: hypothetical protein GX898_11585, partial [Corynebacterium sp.]|nr:hypothetical protein [Corynebacterium sp.]